MGLAEKLVQMRDAKQQHAATQLDMMLRGIQAGLPISPSAFEKTAKQAGIPLMKPEELKQMVATARQGSMTPSPAAAGGPAPGGQPAQPGAGGGAASGAGVTAMTQGNRGVVDQKSYTLNGWIAAALQKAQLRGETEQKQMEILNRSLDLKKLAYSGDMQAIGALQKLGEIPFDIKLEEWQNATPEQRQGIIDVAAGRVTEADKEKEAKDFADTLFTTGKITDMADATRAGRALAMGGDIPQDVRARMKPFTFAELTSQATMTTDAIAAGVPPKQLGQFLQKANQVGFAAALPKDIRPVVLQQLDVSKAHLGIAQQELKLRQAEMVLTGAKLDMMAKKEEDKATMDNFKSMLDMEKIKKGSVPQPVLDAAMDEVAKRSGLQRQEIKTWWDYATFSGPSGHEYVPGPGYKGLTPGSAGTPQVGKESPISRFIKQKAGQAGRQIKGVLEGESSEDISAREGPQ
jgi:hypothetical protein